MSAASPLRTGANDAELAALKAATAFGYALTTAVYWRDPEGSAARVKLLVPDYSPALGPHHDEVSGPTPSSALPCRGQRPDQGCVGSA